MAQETRASGRVRRRRWWRPRLLGVLIVGLGCFWWVWNSQPAISLPNGAIVVVDRLSYGTEHEPEQTFLRKLSTRFRGDPGGLQRMGAEWDTIGIWLKCQSAWLHRPRKFDDVGNVILIDRDGWAYSGGPLQEMERTWDGAYLAGTPVNLTTLRGGSDVATVVMRPVVRPRGGRLTVGIVDGEGSLLGTTDVPFPGPVPPESTWRPDELTVTKTVGDLSVTLLGVDFRAPEPDLERRKYMPGPTPGILVIPRFEVHWKGRSCTDCWLLTGDGYLGAVRTPLSAESARVSRRNPCPWSPFEPAWEWTHYFYPGPTAEFDANEVWDGGDVAIPAPGNLLTVVRRGQIHDGEYGVEYAGGPGQHELTVEIGQRINLHKMNAEDGRYRVTGRRMNQGVTLGTYDVETDVPFLVLSSPPKLICKADPSRTTPSFHTLLQIPSGQTVALKAEMLSWVQWTDSMKDGVDDPREYWIAFLPKELGDVHDVHLTLAEYRFHEFRFFIRPPNLDVYEQLNLLPETVPTRRTTRD
jgi:hypothetical protein